MRLILYIFLFVQLLDHIYIFGEELRKENLKLNNFWEKTIKNIKKGLKRGYLCLKNYKKRFYII